MSDHIIRAIAPGVRMVAAITTELAEEARTRYNCSPVAAAALGRTMTAALLLAEQLRVMSALPFGLPVTARLAMSWQIHRLGTA